jgi:hypothetical protein
MLAMITRMLRARIVPEVLFAVVVFSGTLLGRESSALPEVPPSVSEIVQRMLTHNEHQNQALLEFEAQRKFFAVNMRFKMDSTMVVQTVFPRPFSR